VPVYQDHHTPPMQVVPVNREALCFSWSLPGESDDGQ
jgi:hypothetical protein